MNQVFDAFIAVFDHDGTEKVQKMANFSFSLTMEPSPLAIQGPNETSSSSPNCSFNSLFIDKPGIYELFASAENMIEGKSEKIYIDTPKLSEILTSISPNAPTSRFPFKITGQVKDQYGKEWTEQVKVKLNSDEFNSIVEVFTSNSRFEFEVVSESPGLKNYQVYVEGVEAKVQIEIAKPRLGLVSNLLNVNFI